MPGYLIATIKSWNIQSADRLRKQYDIKVITDKEELTLEYVKELNPRYIFFPHWSWKIPEEIYENYECVGFHETDLPYGRGGSPIQNLIVRGFTNTKISALRVTGEIDAGPIYLKRDLALEGTATDIFNRAAEIISNMIRHIISKEPKPAPQEGKATVFQRRTPEQSEISNFQDVPNAYEHIRMLDAEGYPLAFIETPKLRIEFTECKIDGDCIVAQARIMDKPRIKVKQ